MCRYDNARDCFLTTGLGSSQTPSPNGWRSTASSMSAARPRIRRPKGKIERWHQTMKNRILLENYYLPGALQAEIAAFVEQCSHRRYHESLNNLTPADVYFGRGQTILLQRMRIKRRTIQHRRLMHHQNAA